MKNLITLIVLIAFVDKDNFAKKYEVGEEITGFDEARIAELVDKGICKIKDGKDDGSGGPVTDIDLSQHHTAVVNQIKSFEDVEKLNTYLKQETASGKPRASVVKALEARIAELVDNE